LANWYGDPGPQQFFDATAFQQAREAAAFIDRLPPARQAVFDVSPLGPFGPISTAQKERTIRAAIPPARQQSVHVFPGDPGDLLAGRRTIVASAEVNRENLPYWQDVRSVLPAHPAIIVLEELGDRQFQQAGQIKGSRPIAPGVLVLHSSLARRPLRAVPPLNPVPRTEIGTARAVGLVALLAIAGLGWALWFLGPAARTLAVAALAPVAGAAVLILAALGVTKSGFALGGAAGIATYLFVTLLGAGLALTGGLALDLLGVGALALGSAAIVVLPVLWALSGRRRAKVVAGAAPP
jgi:hypothetical protein